MKKLFLQFIVTFLVTSCFSQDIASKLEELMQAYTKQYKFNGTALVAYDGKILLDKGY
jgi:hypothetical protein